MKSTLPPLNGLKVFESAARHLSFSLAAEELHMSKGAVSYQIKKLEEHVKCALFKRSIRQVYLTDAGQTLLQTTQTIFEELNNTFGKLHAENHQAGVTLAATTDVAARWLSPRLSLFNETYPNTTIRLQHSVNSADFKLSDVDIAIQWCEFKEKTDKNRFTQIHMPLYPAISPALLQKHNINANDVVPVNALEKVGLSEIPLLCEDRHLDLWEAWFAVAGCAPSATMTRPRRIMSDANVRVQAAIDGQGFILADDLMLNEINNGLLVVPFKPQLEGYGYAFLSATTSVLSEPAINLKQWLRDAT